jgi:hypothetical protein
MTTRKKQVVDNDYSKLDEHCIWLHEYYKSLRGAGFSTENSLWLLASPDSYPSWAKKPTLEDIRKYIEDEED